MTGENGGDALGDGLEERGEPRALGTAVPADLRGAASSWSRRIDMELVDGRCAMACGGSRGIHNT
eukprot:712172-Prymnesium_polylepis.1